MCTMHVWMGSPKVASDYFCSASNGLSNHSLWNLRGTKRHLNRMNPYCRPPPPQYLSYSKIYFRSSIGGQIWVYISYLFIFLKELFISQKHKSHYVNALESESYKGRIFPAGQSPLLSIIMEIFIMQLHII